MALEPRQVWLVTNQSSGSNDAASADSLRAAFADAGWEVARTLCFPDEGIPAAADLRAAGDPVVAIYTGDGTVNSFVTALEGWGGQILVLPGGTQNLLSKRMHGEASADEIVARIGRGALRAVRITAIRCTGGQALVDLLAGPGPSWNNVREALREGNIVAAVGQTGEAVSATAGGSGVRCIEPALGPPAGYPLMKLMPTHRGIQVDGYYANKLSEFLQQGWALLRRDFRSGPHDRLGLVDRLVMTKDDGSAVDVLLDGEPAQLGPRAEFTLAECAVDLLATDHGF